MIKTDKGRFLLRETDLYTGGKYIGHYRYDMFRRIFDSYRKCAFESAQSIDWDEIILYAVIRFENNSKSPVSAFFMLERMTEERYFTLNKQLEKGCRCFFVRNRQEEINEK